MFSFLCCLKPNDHTEPIESSFSDDSIEKTPRTDKVMMNPLDNSLSDEEIVNDN